ncbi:hypothetical protein A0H81_09681 [Grifola frondosa]|uniref:Uncharacterized protein n=1 Tax=Grifola frondosa TaxID=5627 RepID=A0A1C7M0P9_GRIFR|nr:hypothetical protein A0H81_09681 [Grifola frondosa]
MSNPSREMPPVPERDKYGGDDLPTYDDLAAQHGPNSRAAERYADVTPSELQRRRQRGWGQGSIEGGWKLAEATQTSQSSSAPGPPLLHLQTDFSQAPIPVSPPAHTQFPPPPAPLIPEPLSPSHLQLYQFGSRFLPHTNSPIRCLLPLSNDHLLLIGHDDGLSVLDMFPREWTDDGLVEKGPSDAVAKLIWEGEGVHQMSILEAESTGEGTPQGVVLALVSSEADSKDQESTRTLRMYNLGSLVRLGEMGIMQKGSRPLDLRQPSLAKVSNPVPRDTTTVLLPPDEGPEENDSWSQSKQSRSQTLNRADSIDSEWDMVEDLPLRWATHYTPLASAGSRLLNSSVLFFDIWRNENQRGRGGSFLPSPQSRVSYYMKLPRVSEHSAWPRYLFIVHSSVYEFYTPLAARRCHVEEPVDVSPRTMASDSHIRHTRMLSFGNDTRGNYSNQLSLFVVFDKKAGLIRIADSAVSEIDLYEDNWNAHQSMLLASPSASSMTARRSRASWDGRGFSTHNKGFWVRPTKIDLPGPKNRPSFTQSMYVLTRGKQSHILPHPLPHDVSMVPPFRTLLWSNAPTNVSCRICSTGTAVEAPFLQVIAFGEDGIEVQEILLAFLSERKGKSRAQEPVRSQSDLGGSTGFLGVGGHWDQPFYSGLSRSDSTASYDSTASLEDTEGRVRGQNGIYGWVCKGHEDWRIIWLGDASSGYDEESNI